MTVKEGHVALILVSHSRALAEGVAALARQMVGERVAISCAAGSGPDDGELGTDAGRILEAIIAADSPAGTVVLMDLGSAILSTEMALDLAEPCVKERVALSAAPFVEGALAAAVTAASGASRAAVAAEALRALAPKAEQLGVPAMPSGAQSGGEGEAAPQAAGDAGPSASVEAVIRDPHGLHARPAGQVATLAGQFRATISIADTDSGKGPADARSLIALMSLSAQAGHRLRVAATGPDAEAAVSALSALIEGFSGDDIAAASPTPAMPKGPIPVSAGIAIGELFAFERAVPPIPAHAIADRDAELAILDRAVEAVARELETGRGPGIGAEMAAMQASLLRDPMLLGAAHGLVSGRRMNAAAAFASAADEAAKTYRALDDPYLRAREADLHDVTRAVIGKLLGVAAPPLPQGAAVILIADELAPSDVLGLEGASILGVIERKGGPTSHAAILLRGLGIPAVAGAGALVAPGAKRAAFDGATGELVIDPSPETAATFAQRREAWLARRAVAKLEKGRVVASNGTAIEIWANAANVAEAKAARAAGAAGIGLLRTEMMFLDRVAAPSEAEQAARLAEIFAAFAGRPIIVRTLDAGGDKPIPYMNMPKEANPYLGVRGLRLSLREMATFETQLRAILLAGAGHDLRIMLPMVTEPSELGAAREALGRAHLALVRGERQHAWPVPLGIMIEVPSAALLARQLARVADFFSIGTNDLTQYALAAERGNPALGAYADAAHPAVLALVAEAVRAADAAKIELSVCGEAAGDEAVALLLAGLGVRKLSMSAASIPLVAARLAGSDLALLSHASAEALAAGSAHEARATIATMPDRAAATSPH